VTNFNEADVRLALIQTEGNLTWAAARCKVTRTELSYFIDVTPSLQTLMADLQEEFDDEAESDLADGVSAGQQWAICFCLNSLLGRKRGYGKPLDAREEAALPKAPKLNVFFERVKKISPEQAAAFDRLAKIACGGEIPEPPAYFKRLQDAGDNVRDALTTHRGNLSRAAKQLGVTRSELKDYLKEDYDLGILAADQREELIDAAESSLRQARHNKKPWAIKFRLQRFSQGRGFSKYPRPQANPQPSPFELSPWLKWDWDRLNNDELEELRQIAEDLEIDPRLSPNPFAPAPVVPDSTVGRVESSRPAVSDAVSRDAESSERSASGAPAPNPSPGPSPTRGGEEEPDSAVVPVESSRPAVPATAVSRDAESSERSASGAVEHVPNVFGNSSTLETCSTSDQRGREKAPYQPTPKEFAAMKIVLSRKLSEDVAQIIIDQWAEMPQFTRDMVLQMMKSDPSLASTLCRDAESSAVGRVESSRPAVPDSAAPAPDPTPGPSPKRGGEKDIRPARTSHRSPEALRQPPPEMEGILARMFSPPEARNIVACWNEVPEYIRAMALEMVEAGGLSQPNPFPFPSPKRGGEEHGKAPMQSNSASPICDVQVSRDAQCSARSDSAPEPVPEKPNPPTPEERCEEYVDEETEREIILSRIYSGPDLEKALGRKPRLGLTSDMPFDCPIDPATGRLKKRPESAQAPEDQAK
jgi:Bacterial regulatory protein, Fis family